jgi:hypothetical protein
MMAVHGKTVLAGLATAVIVVLAFSYFCPSIQAQTRTTFTSSDRFTIPQLNGAITFAENGSYLSAVLENGTWTFTDIRFNQTQSVGTLKVSAENSNMTIIAYSSFSFFGRNPTIYYNAAGDGRQTVNLGLNSTTHSSEWSIVVKRNIFLAEGEGWHLLPDNTVVLSGLTGNISVTHINFGLPNDGNSNGNLPFYVQHSVIITVAAALAVVVATAIMLKVKVRA